MKTKSKKGLNPHYLEINVSPVVPLQQEKKKEEKEKIEEKNKEKKREKDRRKKRESITNKERMKE